LSAGGSKLAVVPVSRKQTEATPTASKSSSKEEDKEDKDDKSKAAPAPSSPSSGENSLYRIAADGTVREVFREKAMVFSVLRQPGRFFVGTGMGGQLFEVDEQ